MSEEEVKVSFGADTAGAEAGIQKVGDKLKDLNPEVRELAETFGGLRRTFVEAFALDKLGEFVEHISELGEQALRTSAMLGIPVGKVQELGFAATMVGGSTEGMTIALERLEKNMADIGNPASIAAKAFAALGISEDDIKNKSPEQVLGLIADKFAGAADGAGKTAIAMDLMGRSGAQMIPLLDEGSAGLEKMGEMGKQTGSILTAMQAEGLEKTAQGITTLKASIEGAGISLFEVFKPAIDSVIQGLTSLIQVLRSATEMIRVIIDLVEGGMAIAFTKVIQVAQEMGIELTNAVGNIKIAFSTLGQAIYDVAHLKFEEAKKIMVEGAQEIAQANLRATAQIAKLSTDYVDLKNKIVDATLAALTFGNAQEKSNKTQLTAPSTGAAPADDEEKEEIAIEKNDLSTQIQLNKLALESRKDTDAQMVASGKMSKQQELEDLKDFAGQELHINVAAIDAEASLYDKDSAQYHELMNKKLILNVQYNNEVQKLTAQSMQLQEAQTKQVFGAMTSIISKDFDTMLTGVLQGTQTWKQAMAKTFDNLAISAIEAIAKIVAEWTVFEVLTEGQGSWGDFMALEGKGGGGLSSLLPSYDVGSWSIPQNQVAMVHAGEMIIPAAQAEQIRSGGASIGAGTGGGGDNYAITIQLSAIDTQTGSQFLQSNAGNIANIIASQMRNNNSSLSSAMRS